MSHGRGGVITRRTAATPDGDIDMRLSRNAPYLRGRSAGAQAQRRGRLWQTVRPAGLDRLDCPPMSEAPTKALLIVDIQNDYFPGGKMELVGSEPASLRAAELIASFRDRRMPVIHMQHVSLRPGATFFLPDTEGVKIHTHVAPADQELVIQKHFPNSFRDTKLLDHLRQTGVQELVIAGMMTHMCIDATTRAAADHG